MDGETQSHLVYRGDLFLCVTIPFHNNSILFHNNSIPQYPIPFHSNSTPQYSIPFHNTPFHSTISHSIPQVGACGLQFVHSRDRVCGARFAQWGHVRNTGCSKVGGKGECVLGQYVYMSDLPSSFSPPLLSSPSLLSFSPPLLPTGLPVV